MRVAVKSLSELVDGGVVQLTRGKIISKKDIAACPGSYPVYSSAKEGDGRFGEYGRYMFDEELITWSVDGGGRLFHRPKHRFSVTNVGGVLRILQPATLDYKYLYYALTLRHSETTFDWVKKAHPSVIKKLYIDIPVPPLAEQQRIVGVLDEAFAGLATAQAHAAQNLQNARALFESHIQSVFTQPALSKAEGRGKGWVEKRLDQVCIVERGSSPRPIKEYFTTAPDGVNWIKIGDTEEGGKYVFSTAQKITPEGAKQSRFVKEGDFILTNSMSFGRPYIMKTSGYIHDGWFVLRLNEGIDTDYFYYLLSSAFVQDQFHHLAAGAVVKNISGDLVKQAILPIPSLQEQKGIVSQFDALAAETQRLTRLYEQKLAALAALKKSLLHQAFTGEL
jgi:type I restriction enzyme S subunit